MIYDFSKNVFHHPKSSTNSVKKDVRIMKIYETVIFQSFSFFEIRYYYYDMHTIKFLQNSKLLTLFHSSRQIKPYSYLYFEKNSLSFREPFILVYIYLYYDNNVINTFTKLRREILNRSWQVIAFHPGKTSRYLWTTYHARDITHVYFSYRQRLYLHALQSVIRISCSVVQP